MGPDGSRPCGFGEPQLVPWCARCILKKLGWERSTVVNPTRVRVSVALVATGLLAWAYVETPSAPLMSETARNFLAALTPDQAAKATFRFEDEERFNWHFIPRTRKGLPLREMKPEQKQLAEALMSAGLSREGLVKALTIMSLDEVLRVIENDSGERRNPEGYYFSIFGDPASPGPWGYRIEGHHLSLNFTLAGGRVMAAPTFFGANPAEVRQGSRRGLRALAREEELGRDLMTALDNDQRKTALVSPTAYKDILTSASRKASLSGQPDGLAASKMNAKQRQLLETLVSAYADSVPADLAAARMEKLRKAGVKVHFAWAGTVDRGGPHYYRVQTPDFLIEYDKTQDNANHIHSVWRDFAGDFGGDLLKQHYETSHR